MFHFTMIHIKGGSVNISASGGMGIDKSIVDFRGTETLISDCVSEYNREAFVNTIDH